MTIQLHVARCIFAKHVHSMSLARLENTIEPMAERVAGIHNKLTGDLDIKIAEILNLMQTMNNMEASPRIWPSNGESPCSPEESWPKDTKKRRTISGSAPAPSLGRADSDTYFYPRGPGKTADLPDSDAPPKPFRLESGREQIDYDRQGLGLIPVERPPRVRSFDEAPPMYNNEWRPVTEPTSPALSSQSASTSMSPNPYTFPQQLARSPLVARDTTREVSTRTSMSSTTYGPSQPSIDLASRSHIMLPPSIIPPDDLSPPSHIAAYDPLYVPQIVVAPDLSHRALATEMEQVMFERELTRDSATLCEA